MSCSAPDYGDRLTTAVLLACNRNTVAFGDMRGVVVRNAAPRAGRCAMYSLPLRDLGWCRRVRALWRGW